MDDKKTSDVSIGTLYDLNKSMVEQSEKKLSTTALQNKKNEVVRFLASTDNQYYMLLCHEKRDYTIFRLTKKELENRTEITNVLIDECLINRGDVKGIDLTQDGGAIEIWLSNEGESCAYYFFPYDAALIEA
jgi:hypothetical protein